MSTDRDVTRIVRSWLHEDAYEDADRILNVVLDEIDTTPQRQASWLARRFPPMNSTPLRLGIAAVVVALAVILGINYFSDANTGGPPESSSSSSAPPPSAIPIGKGVDLSAGTYSLSSFPARITFQVPAGWNTCSESVVEQQVCHKVSETNVIAVAFLVVENVVADPCGSADALLDPPVGPSVDDLVGAISSLDGFQATAPLELTVDGFQGKQFTLTAPDVADCGFTWATSNRTAGMGPGEANLVRILDVDGVRVVITGAYSTTEAADVELTALHQVIASVHIQP